MRMYVLGGDAYVFALGGGTCCHVSEWGYVLDLKTLCVDLRYVVIMNSTVVYWYEYCSSVGGVFLPWVVEIRFYGEECVVSQW